MARAAVMAAKSDTGMMEMLLLVGGGYLVYEKVIKPKIMKPVQLQQNLQRLMPVMHMDDVKLTKNSLNFTLHIANPNPTPITVQAVVGTVKLTSNDGKTNYDLGIINKFGNTVIQAVGETTATISVMLKAGPLVNYFTDLLLGNIHGQMVSFTGTATIDGTPYPVHLSYKIA